MVETEPLNFICFQLRAATRRVMQRYDEALSRVGLRAGQFAILSFAEDCPALNITRVAKLLDMDISTATRSVRGLVSDGYIVAKTVAGDARQRELWLTARGRHILERAREQWIEVDMAIARDLGSSRHDQLRELLFALRSELTH